MMLTASYTRRVAEYFQARPNRWLSAAEIMRVGGICAWRPRVADARKEFGLVIENRLRRIRRDDGTSFVVSEYRLVAGSEAHA